MLRLYKFIKIIHYLWVNEEWPNIVLHCYTESEIELFYMKWLILDRLADARLMPLRNVWGWFQCTYFFHKNKPCTSRAEKFRTYVNSKVLTLWAWKGNYHSITRKSLGLKLGLYITRTLRVNLHSVIALPECHGTTCSKQVQYLKSKWLKRDSKPQPFRSLRNTRLFSLTG